MKRFHWLLVILCFVTCQYIVNSFLGLVFRGIQGTGREHTDATHKTLETDTRFHNSSHALNNHESSDSDWTASSARDLACTEVGGCRKNVTAVVYNRIPKCGSRTVLSAMRMVAKSNAFNVYVLNAPSSSREFPPDAWEEARYNFSHVYQQPFLYSQHLHFFDFNKATMNPPSTVYVNVVRDPIERLISHYYFRQYGDQNGAKAVINTTLVLEECLERYGPANRCLAPEGSPLAFLCGHSPVCKYPGSDAVQHAKRIIEKYYVAVGLTEDLPGFLHVLEYLLPGFFSGVSKQFSIRGAMEHDKYRTKKKKELDDKTRELLKRYLSWDYELYGFVTARYYAQLNTIRRKQGIYDLTDIKHESNTP